MSVTQEAISQPAVAPFQPLTELERINFQNSIKSEGKSLAGFARSNQLDRNAIHCVLNGTTKGYRGLAFKCVKAIREHLEDTIEVELNG